MNTLNFSAPSHEFKTRLLYIQNLCLVLPAEIRNKAFRHQFVQAIGEMSFEEIFRLPEMPWKYRKSALNETGSESNILSVGFNHASSKYE